MLPADRQGGALNGQTPDESGVSFQDTSQGLSQTLEATIGAIDGHSVTLRQLLVLMGEQGLLLLCALLTIPFLLPVSVPGVSTVFGAATILIGTGIAMNRIPWLPRRLLDRSLDAARLVPVLQRGARAVRRLDRVLHPRMSGLTDGATINRLNGLAIVAGGVLLCMPLGFVPFSNTLPALAILFTAAGVSERDGLFVLLGYLMLCATLVYFAVLGAIAYAAGQGLTSRLWPG